MYISLCLIAKDENSYLQEWLDYHILLGIDHFWIYDNDSTFPLEESIKEYILKGWVTINNIHGKGMQLYAYDDCIQTYGSLSKWIGFIDTDEFIVPKNGELLPDYLKKFESFGGLAISSLFFGSDEQMEKPLCGQVAGYSTRSPNGFLMNQLVKSIVQPDKVLYPMSPHHFMYTEGSFCVNEKKQRVDTQLFPCSTQEIQLNHYFTRSSFEWGEKIRRGRGDEGNPYSDQRWVTVNENSTVVDNTAFSLLLQKFIIPPALKKNQLIFHDPYSSKFIGLLSDAASKIQPQPFIEKASRIIEKRDELVALLKALVKGMDLMKFNNFLEAKKIYIQLLREFPFDLYPYTNLALASIGLRDFPAAWETLAQAWRMAPRNWAVLLCMVDYFYAIEDYEQVEKCSFLIQGLFGDLNPVGAAVLALSQWKMGKTKEASLTAAPLLSQITPELAATNTHYKELVELIRPQG